MPGFLIIMALEKIGVEAVIEGLSSFRSGIGGMEKDVSGFGTSVKNSLVGIGGVAAKTVVAGMATATAAVAGFAVAGSKAFINFERGMNEVFTLLPGISEDAMGAMEDQVLELSRTFGTLPENAIPALYQALSAGVPQDNVFAFLETANKAAIGGVTDLETAVDGITSITNAYGAELISAAQASDIMFTAVRLGKTDFTQLSSSLFNVIPTASALGISFGDVSAQLAVLTGQGTPTSVATTQLRSAFVEASKGGTKLSNAIQELTGESFADLITDGKTSTEVFQLVRDSMPEQEFKDLFGSVEALNAVLGTTGPNFEKTQAAMEEMTNSSGATDAAFGTMSEGLQMTIDRLKAFGSTALIEIGKSLEPLLKWAANFAEQALPKVQAAIDTTISTISTIIDTVGKFFANLDEGMSIMDAFIEAIWDIAPPDLLNFFTKTRDAFSGGFDTLLPAVKPYIEQFIANLGDVLVSGLKDISAFLGVDIATPIINAFGKLTTVVIPSIVKFVKIAGTNLSQLGQILAPIGQIFIAFGQQISDAFQSGGLVGAINSFTQLWPGIVVAVQVAIDQILAFVGQKIGIDLLGIFQNAQLIISTLFTTISAIISSVVTAVTPAIQGFIAGFTSAFSSFAPVGESFKELWVTLQPIVEVALVVIGGALLGLLSLVTGVFAGIIAAINPFITTLGFVLNGVINFVNGVIQTFVGLFTFIQGAMAGNKELMLTSWESIKEGVTNIVLGLVEAVVGLWVGLNTTLKAFADTLVTSIIQFFQNLYMALVGGSIVPDMVRAIIQWFVDMKDRVISTIIEFIASAITQITEFSQNFIAIFSDTKDRVIEKITELIDGAKEVISNSIDGFVQLGRDIIDGVAKGIDIASGKIGQIVKQAVQNAISAARRFLGIESPSKLMMKVIGTPMAEGIAVGIDQPNLLTSAFDNLFAQSIPALQSVSAQPSVVAGGGTVINNSREANLNFGDTNINNDTDVQVLRDFILRTVRDNI